MYVRGYLRASTEEQNASRAQEELERFAAEHDTTVVSWYVENVSGATTQRPELLRLLEDARHGDVILVEAVDRLSRLSAEDWHHLRGRIDALGLRVVALDLPTSHAALTATQDDDFTARILDAVNRMMLDTLAAVARKGYEERRRRARQGIERAKREGKYSKPTGAADAEPSPQGRKILRSKTRSGRFVTLGTASIKDQPFASWEKVRETLETANAASRETIRKHRAELLGKD